MNLANNRKIDVISMGLALGHITLVAKPSAKMAKGGRRRLTGGGASEALNSKERSVCDSATD